MTVSTTFSKLWMSFPSKSEFTRDQLFESLGWDDLKGQAAYENTCAIRMSFCLIRAGITVPGRLKIHKGAYKNKWIEPGQIKLTHILARSGYFGAPEKISGGSTSAFSDKQGIVSFIKIPGYVVDGGLSGHIDLVRSGKFLWLWDQFECASDCYWNAAEYWFWPVK